MSYITEAVIVFWDSRGEYVERACKPLSFQDDASFRALAVKQYDGNYAGGTKVFCDTVLAAAFNYAQIDDLISWFFDTFEGTAAVMTLDTEGWRRVVYNDPNTEVISARRVGRVVTGAVVAGELEP